MDPQKIGKFICRRRKELHMTQKELAEKLGITDQSDRTEQLKKFQIWIFWLLSACSIDFDLFFIQESGNSRIVVNYLCLQYGCVLFQMQNKQRCYVRDYSTVQDYGDNHKSGRVCDTDVVNRICMAG